MFEAVFTGDIEFITLSGLYQWDYGQKLYIKGVYTPNLLEVHFANYRSTEAVKMIGTKEGDYYTFDIPNSLLQEPFDITAWVYDVREGSGKTTGTIILKVEEREKPQDYTSENPEVESIEALVTKLVAGNMSSASDKHYTHNQSQASSEWAVTHNLGKNPSVTIVDSAGTEVIGEIEHISLNECVLKFKSAFSGKAYFN